MAEEHPATIVTIPPYPATDGYIPPVTVVATNNVSEFKMNPSLEEDSGRGTKLVQPGSKVKKKDEADDKWKSGHSRQKSLPVGADLSCSGAEHARQKSLVLIPHQDPYLGVYTTTPSSVPNVSISTSTSAYTVDSR